MDLPRHAVLQSVLNLYDAPSYLEVGVFDGTTFRRLQAHRKVAVDPNFQFDIAEAKRYSPESEYFEVRSDVYFDSFCDYDRKFNVIYLDGLHTFDQTLRDLINSIEALTPNGIIVVDDVFPRNYQASLPSHEVMARVSAFVGSNDPAWMGDTYKLTFFIESFMPQLSFRTIVENHGQLVVWRSRRPIYQPRSLSEISALPFHQFVDEVAALRLSPFDDIIAEVKASVLPAAPR